MNLSVDDDDVITPRRAIPIGAKADDPTANTPTIVVATSPLFIISIIFGIF
jgi:hypothetical protein